MWEVGHYTHLSDETLMVSLYHILSDICIHIEEPFQLS